MSVKIIGKPLLVAQFEADATGVADLRKWSVRDTTHIVNWSAGVSAGVVEIEVADKPDYDGNWASVGTITYDGSTISAPKQDVLRIPGSYSAMRHRISTIIADGTVTTKIDGSA